MDLSSVTVGASTASSPAGSALPAANFPVGLRVLLVDDDRSSVSIIEQMLRKCLYDVTACTGAAEALSMLRERKGRFDLVLSDVYMPDMDGLKLLDHIRLEMDLPVVLMSGDDHKDVVTKAVINHGAVDYLIKPLSVEMLKNIWLHVLRKKLLRESKELEHSGSLEDNEKQKEAPEEGDDESTGSGGSGKNAKRKIKDEDAEDAEEHEDPTQMKKPRVVWSSELHEQFVNAVDQLGIEKAVPKKILELMKVPGLTRENVASHLQKYRLYLRKASVQQHQGPFATAQEATINSVGTVNGFDLQALAASGQLLPQNFTAPNSGARRATNTGLGMPAFEQVGFLSSGDIANDPNARSVSLQQRNNRGLSYFSGSSNGIGHSHQLVQPYGNMNLQVVDETSGFLNLPSSQTTRTSLSGGTINGQVNKSLIMQMAQHGQQFSLPQQHNNLPGQAILRGQMLNEVGGGHDPRLLSKLGVQMSQFDIPSHMPGRNANIAQTCLPGNHMNGSYSSVPQAMYANVQNNCITESATDHYPVESSLGSTPATGNVEALSNTNSLDGVADFLPSYDVFSTLIQDKSQDWKMQRLNLSYQSGQHIGPKQNGLDFGPSLVAHQDSNASIKDRNSRNTCRVTKQILSVRTEIEHECIGEGNSTILVENSVRVKSEGIPDIKYQDVFYDDNVISDEIMDAAGEQQQEGIEEDDSELFDGYSLDNIPE